jgi:hypothetical protein
MKARKRLTETQAGFVVNSLRFPSKPGRLDQKKDTAADGSLLKTPLSRQASNTESSRSLLSSGFSDSCSYLSDSVQDGPVRILTWIFKWIRNGMLILIAGTMLIFALSCTFGWEIGPSHWRTTSTRTNLERVQSAMRKPPFHNQTIERFGGNKIEAFYQDLITKLQVILDCNSSEWG